MICTRNRAPQLAACLESLLRQHCQAAWQIVIVDNGSTDDTQAAIEKYRSKLTCEIKSIIELKPGLGRARNKGWKAADGEFISFTDDDCYPAEDYLDAMLSCFEREAIGFVGGRVLLHDPTDFPCTIQTLDRPVQLHPGDFIPPGVIHGANFAFRRTALEKVNGFDDRMGAGTPFACEDVDILARLLANGITGIYDPRPLVYHHHGRKTAAEAASLGKTYDHGVGAYYAKCMLNPVLRKMLAKNWCLRIRNQGGLRRYAKNWYRRVRSQGGLKMYAKNWYWLNQGGLKTLRRTIGGIHFLIISRSSQGL